MSTDCVITFDHENCVYHSGETLNGYVKLQTEKPKSIRAISIKVVGYEKVFWSETSNKSSTNFTSHEQYLNSVTYVLGSPDGESFDLEAGIYEYTFSCHLSEALPTSMIETNCKIKYKVIVTIDRRLRFDNVFKKDFLVSQTSNLNIEANNKLPRRNAGIKEIAPFFGCCCLKGTDITAELIIPCSGYVPGQKIPCHLIVHNESNVDLSGAKITFLKCFTYQSTEPYVKQMEVEKEINKRLLSQIPRHTNKKFKNFFIVPLLPPTNRTRYMKIEYKLKAKIYVFGYSTKKFYVEVPITIGTIPINGFDPSNINLEDDFTSLEYNDQTPIYTK